jgi:outer membrane receptor protein involved in Fe transport
VELGFRGRPSGNLVWNVGLFHAENRDDIMFVADDTSGFGFFQNFGKTRRQGAEAGVTARVGAFDVGANYTFLDATYRSDEEVLGEGNSTNEEGAGFEGSLDVHSGDRIPLTPRHIFKAFATWRILPQLSANVDLITIAGSYARGNENNQHEPDGVFYIGPGRTGGYTVANLGLSYAPISPLTLFAQLNNLLDREYYTASQLGSTGFNAAGNFVARPFAGPIVDGERPLLGSTFFAPGRAAVVLGGYSLLVRQIGFVRRRGRVAPATRPRFERLSHRHVRRRARCLRRAASVVLLSRSAAAVPATPQR